jgi:hypothetical protein
MGTFLISLKMGTGCHGRCAGFTLNSSVALIEIGEDQSDAAASAAFSDVARERLGRAQRTTSERQKLPFLGSF